MRFKKKFITWSGNIVEDGVYFSHQGNHLTCGVLRNNKREGFGFILKQNGNIICTCYQKDKLVDSFELPIHLETRNAKIRNQVAAYLLHKANPTVRNCTDRPFTVALSRSLDQAMSVEPHLASLKCVGHHKNRFVDYALNRHHIKD